MKIVILCGGISQEREVSLSSAYQIHDALIDAGHRVMLLDPYIGYDCVPETVEGIFTTEKVGTYEIADYLPDLGRVEAMRKNADGTYWGSNVLVICQSADVVFIALHGAEGENGKIQAALSLLNIKFTGTGYFGSALAMNKHYSKIVANYIGVKTPTWKVISSYNEIFTVNMNYPIVVKPVSEGSSIGVSLVKRECDLLTAVQRTFRYGDSVMVEEYVKGRELSVGILGNQVLPPIEILTEKDFFDYADKYGNGCTEEICPAEIEDGTLEELQNISLKLHHALNLSQYSRMDYVVTDTDDIYFLEANTLPGLTHNSLLPKEAKACGISFSEFCDKIVKCAMHG